MIKPGTLCLIVAAVQQPHFVGRSCTLMGYDVDVIAQALGLNCLVHVPHAPARSQDGLWATHTSCLIPIEGGPEEILLFEVEREHAS